MSEEQRPIAVVSDLSVFVQRQQLGEATSQIQYVSQGHCLIIGEVAQALSAGERFSEHGFTVVQIDPEITRTDKRLTDDGIAVFSVPALSLNGYLGAYRAVVPMAAGEELDLGVSVYRETGLFDVVLDLSSQAVMPVRLAPFGYVHATTAEAIDEAVDSLNDMRGEFEKPRYFNYNESTCAHSRSELDGCNQCIDICTAEAITPSGEGVSVDPFLCQGCGSCATVCPSGAMSYAYPRVSDALERSRKSLRENQANTIILHTEEVQSLVDEAASREGVLSLLVEEVSAFGPDYWLSMLAGAVQHILVVTDSPADDPGRQALDAQLQWVGPLLAELGIDEVPVELLASTALDARLQQLAVSRDPASPLENVKAQSFSTHNEKRQTLRLALDALSEQLRPAEPIVKLPSGAPFGQIHVDTTACTLCMACVSTCPAKALQDGQDTPALRFVEANCLQCGLCESACPESAISLEARYIWDSVAARKVETLHEETPFHCVRCHTPFATQSMIDNMTQKLAGHWMFQNDKAVRRLRLCGDCRVRDMFEEDAAGIDVHNL
ncbi:4Fe-4S binding protein [Granulosicoccus antarcticus]|uniref:Ferredoxin n=1 Tax=Granulosicoccus antarcticus IMCC3135 TaxID=1192854 RepID=A0A2Z2NUD5_9GAMM|nr:4Fe-4S binding protein [Granulosicoccus antarcticus]ASJ75116.1 Ferredoxin [Granulosicoccus antarcticus IMCC3135]